ncbi:hypothetical protein A1D23_04605 [Chelonobacter oris]|uniref:colicin E1 family microcin immunity protein n=1 Tax=Chelonobacter oris TaxID=505317 RepID=UPI002A32DC2E|nr:hypothetical protein [Chelonobacter oris]
MDKNYYFKSIKWGTLLGILWIYIFHKDGYFLGYIFPIISTLSYPFSKWAVEKITLHFTTKEFWSRGILFESAAKKWDICNVIISFYFYSPSLSLLFIAFFI